MANFYLFEIQVNAWTILRKLAEGTFLYKPSQDLLKIRKNNDRSVAWKFLMYFVN